MARDVDEQVLEWIDQHFATIPAGYLVGNQYISGSGSSWRSKMSHKYAIVALALLVDEMDNSKTLSATMFQTDFCAPMRHMEMWETSIIKRFGKTASTFAAFARVVKTRLGERVS